MASPAQSPRPRRREPGVRRDAMRDRLIESRLTPNAISLTGFALNVVAAALVTFVVVATANHWWFDAFTGALTAGVAALAAMAFARARPAAWAWMPVAPAPAAR